MALGAIRRAWSGRAAGKFRRNRLAMASMAIIAVYALIGVWLVAGDLWTGAAADSADAGAPWSPWTAMTLDKVEARVGPLSKRGWLESESGESRARNVKYYMSRFEKALRLSDPEYRRLALKSIRFGERRVGVGEKDAARIIAEAKARYRALDVYDDLDDPKQIAKAEPELARLETLVNSLFAPMSPAQAVMYDLRLSLGTDRQGRSIFARAVYSIKVALELGLIVGVVSVLLGAVLGAAAAYYSGWIDGFVQWLYSTLSSVPDLVLLAVLAYMFTGSYFDDTSKPFLSLVPVYVAMCMTFWIGPCRIIRGETLKLKELEYVQAAKAIGFGRPYILLRHVLPNTLHLMFINFSLLFIAAIKFEVVLSFLGLGVKTGPSWGRMISEATQEVINGNFWQIGAATVFMFVLVLAFNIVSDALQDAFDPKHVG